MRDIKKAWHILHQALAKQAIINQDTYFLNLLYNNFKITVTIKLTTAPIPASNIVFDTSGSLMFANTVRSVPDAVPVFVVESNIGFIGFLPVLSPGSLQMR